MVNGQFQGPVRPGEDIEMFRRTGRTVPEQIEQGVQIKVIREKAKKLRRASKPGRVVSRRIIKKGKRPTVVVNLPQQQRGELPRSPFFKQFMDEEANLFF